MLVNKRHSMVKRIIDYVKLGIWEKDEGEYHTKVARWAVRQFKIFIVALKGFDEHDLFVRSAGLTFYTLMSLVPIVALVFSVVKGFGMDAQFIEYLYAQFPQAEQLINTILEFAENQLLRTKGGVVAITAFVVLIWAVVRVFSNIESVFNRVWEVRKRRSITRMFSDYITLIFIVPILWIISDGMIIYFKTQIADLANSLFVDYLFGFGALVAMWIMFAFIYAVMPNTKVDTKCAIVAGIVTGTIFQIFQVVYFYIQGEVSAYNVIYGSFAALPLFLIWLQTSWQILFFGAELSFAYQNIQKYEQEQQSQHMSYDNRRKVVVAVMVLIAKKYLKGEGPVTSESISKELNLPLRVVRDVIFDLDQAHLVLPVQSEDNKKVNNYVPARDVHKMTVYGIITDVEGRGEYSFDSFENQDVEKISHIINSIKGHAMSAPENVLLTEVMDI